MTKKQAIQKLKETKCLSTDLLKPLGISFEAWLRFCQMPDADCEAIIERLLARFG